MRPALILITFYISITLGGEELPQTRPLEIEGDLSVRMVSGISRFLDLEINTASKVRRNFWNRDRTSDESYLKSVSK